MLTLVLATECIRLISGSEGKDIDSHTLRIRDDSSKEIIYLIEDLGQWERACHNMRNRKFVAQMKQYIDVREVPSSVKSREVRKKDRNTRYEWQCNKGRFA